jgi:uncharacterized protein YajQ (UPF0234 family)
MPSFDVVSKTDLQEIDNAINIAKKELANRFDFKGSKASIEFTKEEIVLSAEDDFKLKQLKDIFENKLTKRGVSLLSIDYQKMEDATLGSLRQKAKIKQGIDKERGKKIIQIIKDSKLKVQSQIMDEQVRVTGKSIDDLQSVIALLKTSTIDLPLDFVNMRS